MCIVVDFSLTTQLCSYANELASLPVATCHETHPYAAETAEFGAVGAEPSVPQLLHTDETTKHLRNTLRTEMEGF